MLILTMHYKFVVLGYTVGWQMESSFYGNVRLHFLLGWDKVQRHSGLLTNKQTRKRKLSSRTPDKNKKVQQQKPFFVHSHVVCGSTEHPLKNKN